MDRDLTKARSTLRILGEGVLVYTLWDIIKPFLLILLPQAEQETAAELPFHLSEMSVKTVVIIFMTLILSGILYLIFRLYVGLAARAEGLGKVKGRGYVIIAFLLVVMKVSAFVLSVWLRFKMRVQVDIAEIMAFLTLEISSAVIVFETALTAVRLKRLRGVAGKDR